MGPRGGGGQRDNKNAEDKYGNEDGDKTYEPSQIYIYTQHSHLSMCVRG